MHSCFYIWAEMRQCCVYKWQQIILVQFEIMAEELFKQYFCLLILKVKICRYVLKRVMQEHAFPCIQPQLDC